MKFNTLFLRHEDAVTLGSADKALILEFVRWSCHFKESQEQDEYHTRKYFADGVWWMQDSMEAWHARMPWLGERTIRRHIDDLVTAGYLIKRVVGLSSGGRAPNFYRTSDQEVRGQNDQRGLEAKMAEVRGQNGHQLEAKMAASFITKNQTKNQTKNPPPSFPDLELAKEWLAYAHETMKWKTAPSSWTDIKFATALSKIRKATDLNEEGLRAMFNFAKGDSFWQDKILSPAALLEGSKNGLKKIDNLLLAMKGSKQYRENKPLAPLTYEEPIF